MPEITSCKICQKESEKVFDAIVLKKSNAINLEYVRFINLHIFCEKEKAEKLNTISKFFRFKFISKYYIQIIKKNLESKTIMDHLQLSER
jgi:hypothetical protein